MRFIDYSEAERCCARLARYLEAELGDELTAGRFVAIPRGGLIVLGMLSYVLGLRQAQLEGAGASPAQLAVLVDDCSLSGARFARALEQISTPRVVFAHLFSHQELRAAIVESEARVEACIAAEDLSESSPEQRAALRSYWEECLPGKRYWLGGVEPIAFSWSEPDRVIWNERTQTLEDDWHQVPPRRCLDTRTVLGIASVGEPPGNLDVGPHVRWRLAGDEVLLWQSQQDRVVGLKEAAGEMWRALVAYGDEGRAAEHLLTRFEVEPATLRDDLRSFTRRLLAQGLLVRDRSGPPDA